MSINNIEAYGYYSGSVGNVCISIDNDEYATVFLSLEEAIKFQIELSEQLYKLMCNTPTEDTTTS